MATQGFNPNKFVKDSTDYKSHSIEKVEAEIVTELPKKKSRKKQTAVVVGASTDIAPSGGQTQLNFLQSDISYMEAYKDTNEQIDGVISDLNVLAASTMDELMKLKASKTIKNKFSYVSNLTENATSIINAKLTAIKEKNKVINDANTMDLRRLKELKLDTSKEDDNTRIANMYDAFINTPIGTGMNVLGPSVQDMTLMGGTTLERMSIGNDQTQWEQGLDPVQNRMLMEAKGTVETVVMFDESTGNRWFEIVDKVTRQPVPNIEKPDDTYIYDLDINRLAGYAKDSNRNVTYPLVLVNGGDNSILNY